MTDREIAICARALSKDYGSRVVLRQVDLEIAVGESVGLIGANGAGKTTLLRCLASLTRPTAGEVRWFGKPVAGDPASRRLLGMVAHENHLYPQLTLRENLVFAARMCGVPRPRQRADQMLRRIALTSFGDLRPAQISKGMRQRVAVARSLVHNPQIILFDEPFAGLDEAGRQWLMELLMTLQQEGHTVCFASHDLPSTQQLAGTVFQLQAGCLHEWQTARIPFRSQAEWQERAA